MGDDRSPDRTNNPLVLLRCSGCDAKTLLGVGAAVPSCHEVVYVGTLRWSDRAGRWVPTPADVDLGGLLLPPPPPQAQPARGDRYGVLLASFRRPGGTKSYLDKRRAGLY